MEQTDTPTRLLFDENELAREIKCSPAFLRKDRRTSRLIPFVRIGSMVRYDMDRVRAALAALEIGGPKQAGRRGRGN